MKHNDLKPCPFCGGEDVIITEYDAVVVFVQCDNCCATFPHFDSKEEAITAWNRRADTAQKEEVSV